MNLGLTSLDVHHILHIVNRFGGMKGQMGCGFSVSIFFFGQVRINTQKHRICFSLYNRTDPMEFYAIELFLAQSLDPAHPWHPEDNCFCSNVV